MYLRVFDKNVSPKAQNVHFRAPETIDCLFGSINNRLILIKAGIQNHPNAGVSLKLADQFMVQRVTALVHALETTRPVHMRDTR